LESQITPSEDFAGWFLIKESLQKISSSKDDGKAVRNVSFVMKMKL